MLEQEFYDKRRTCSLIDSNFMLLELFLDLLLGSNTDGSFNYEKQQKVPFISERPGTTKNHMKFSIVAN